MHDDTTAPRPDNACLLHAPPNDGSPWKLPDMGYRTCSGCLNRMRDTLTDIRQRWAKLDPAAKAANDLEGRAAPGFGSRSPASPHVVSMRDARSKSCEVAVDGSVYDWDPNYQPRLPRDVEGPLEAPGAYVRKREVWFGSDGRPHSEQERPPLSVHGTISGLCFLIAEDRAITCPAGTVDDLCRWLDNHLDHVTRQDWVADVDEPLRDLNAQLKPATGDGRRAIGECTTLVGDDGDLHECGTKLYAPTVLSWDDTVRCRGCKREWTRREWLQLADLLEAA